MARLATGTKKRPSGREGRLPCCGPNAVQQCVETKSALLQAVADFAQQQHFFRLGRGRSRRFLGAAQAIHLLEFAN